MSVNVVNLRLRIRSLLDTVIDEVRDRFVEG